MKRLRTILAAFLIAASVAFSACQTTPDMHSAVPKTAYLYSCNGEPIDTIENVDRFFYNGKFFSARLQGRKIHLHRLESHHKISSCMEDNPAESSDCWFEDDSFEM